jgi:hypothetical protein
MGARRCGNRRRKATIVPKEKWSQAYLTIWPSEITNHNFNLEIITLEIWPMQGYPWGETRLRIHCSVIYPRLLLLHLQHLTGQAAADCL